MANQNERFKIKVGIKIDEKSAYNEIKTKLKQIEKQLAKTGKIEPFNQANIKKYNKELLKTKTRLKNVNSKLTDTGKKSKKTFDDTDKSVKKTNKGITSYLSNFGSMISAFAKFKIIMMVFENLERAIKSLFVASIDIEKKMAEFSIVSGATGDELSYVNTQINRMVTNLGALKTEVTDAATEFARAGYSMANSMELAKNAIIGARVGFSDMDTVSVNLVATLKGFRLEASESSNVINDMFVASKTAAITFDGLGEAIKRSASAMNVAGASFEESISIISGANEAVQDAAKVGSALKTISARLRGVDEASNLPQLSAQMRNFGVEIEKSSGGFRNVYDILGDLSERFQESTDEFQKQAIAESLAGKRRANVLLSLLNNWEKVEEVRMKALSSSEEAEEAQARLLETSSGQIEKMKGNWQVFADSVINSDAVLNALSFINKTLEGINAEMELNKKLSDDEGFLLSGILEGATQKQVGQGASITGVLFGKTEKEIRNDYSNLIKDIGSMTLNELENIRTEISPLAEEYINLTTSIKENEKSISEMRKRSGGLYKREIENTSEVLEIQKQKLRELIVTMGEHNIVGDDVSEVMELITEAMGELNKETEKTTESTEQTLRIRSQAYKDYVDNYKILTDSQKTEMKNLIDQDIDNTKLEIQNSKSRIETYGAEQRAFAEMVRDKIDKMKGLVGTNKLFSGIGQGFLSVIEGTFDESAVNNNINKVIADEKANLDKLLGQLDEAEGEYNKFFETTSNGGKSSSATKPLSELEIKLRDVRFETDKLNNTFEQTDSYKAQIDLINQLIKKQEIEKGILEELASEQLALAESEKYSLAERQDAMKSYQSLQLEIGKTEKAVYDYKNELVDLNKEQDELIKKQNEQLQESALNNISKAREKYDEMFSDLKDKYEDDYKEFERKQQKKIDAVDKSIERLRRKYDEESFENEEEKLLDSIAKLEKEKLKLRLDDSLKAEKRKDEIIDELETENVELDELRRQREFELDEQALEDKKSKLEEEIDERKQAYDEQLDDLDDYKDDVNDKLDDMRDNWEDFSGNVNEKMRDDFNNTFESISEGLSEIIDDMNEIDRIDLDFSKSSSSNKSSSGNTPSTGKSREQIAYEYEKKHGHRPDSGVIDAIKKTGGTFKDGGIIGKGNFTESSFLDELSNLSNGEVPFIGHEDEMVFNQTHQGILGEMLSSGNQIGNLINIENLEVSASSSYDVEQVGSDLAKGARKEIAKTGL